MTGFELHGRRVHGLGRKPLKVGIDGPIELRDGIPGKFRAPGHDRGPSGKDRGCGGPLRGIEHLGLSGSTPLAKYFKNTSSDNLVKPSCSRTPARTGPDGNFLDSATKSSSASGARVAM
jgi:hypothetical protein